MQVTTLSTSPTCPAPHYRRHQKTLVSRHNRQSHTTVLNRVLHTYSSNHSLNSNSLFLTYGYRTLACEQSQTLTPASTRFRSTEDTTFATHLNFKQTIYFKLAATIPYRVCALGERVLGFYLIEAVTVPSWLTISLFLGCIHVL